MEVERPLSLYMYAYKCSINHVDLNFLVYRNLYGSSCPDHRVDSRQHELNMSNIYINRSYLIVEGCVCDMTCIHLYQINLIEGFPSW